MLAGEAGGEQGPASPWDITMVTSRPPARLLRRVCAGRGCRGACPFLPRRDEGNVCACVCTCVCARGVLFNVYISTIYTLRSWGPYIYSIPCLGSASSKGQNDFAGGTDTLEGGSDARVRRGEWGRSRQAPPSRLSPSLYTMQSPVQRLLGFLGRGNGQAAASPELTWAMALHQQSHHPKPRRRFGFCRERAVPPGRPAAGCLGRRMRPSGSRRAQGCGVVLRASPRRVASRGDVTGS